MASNDPDEGRAASDGGDLCATFPFRASGAHPAHAKARPELRDSYTYYAELLVAVDGHGLSLPQPRASQDDPGPDLAGPQSRDAMVVRFDDTWT